MNGLINVLKPPGMSSHDVVNFIRRLTGIKKVGHTGTLDPGAAGVLPVCCGKATRLIEYLEHDKQYRAEIAFGAVSSTGDSFGSLSDREVPGYFSRKLVEDTLACFTGEISQIPPMTSAVRHQGKKLYELARQGKVVDRKPRSVKIYKIEMAAWQDDSEKPRAILDIDCSAGTYIRTLCQDIGEKIGCGAYMSFLLRTAAGGYQIGEACTPEELEELAGQGRLPEVVESMEKTLSFFPAVEIKEGTLNSVSSGSTLYPPGVKTAPPYIREGDMVSLGLSGDIVAVARVLADERGRLLFRPVKILV